MTNPDHKLPISEKIAFGAGQIGNGISWMPKYIVTPLLVMQFGMSPVVVSTVMTVFAIWDAISDPVMGSISDNFRSRWGRRRPFLMLGAILSAITLPLIFMFDRTWSNDMILTYFIIGGVIFYTCDTIYNMPYQSMGLELTPDYNERTSVTAYRGIIGKATNLFFAWIWAFTQMDIFANPETGEADTLIGTRWASLLCAGVILCFSTLPAIFCKERYYHLAEKQKKEPLIEGMKKSLTCKPFLLLLGLIFLFLTSSGAVGGFGIYLLTYYVFVGDQGAASVMSGYAGTAANLAGIAIVPIVVVTAKKYSKHKVLKTILIVKAFYVISFWFCYNPDYPYLVVIPSVIGAPLMAAIWVVIPSMLADVVDHDELTSYERREGNFSAVFSWSVKTAFTVTTAISGPLLVLSGFDIDLGVNQTPEALQNMRYMMIGIPLVGLIGCVTLMRFYKLTPETAAETKRILEERRGVVG